MEVLSSVTEQDRLLVECREVPSKSAVGDDAHDSFLTHRRGLLCIYFITYITHLSSMMELMAAHTTVPKWPPIQA